MHPRRETRWMTRFGSWVSTVGVSNIVAHLNTDPDTAVSRNTVYEWLSGHSPHPQRANALVEFSNGALSLDDIYAHRREMCQRSQCGLIP